VESTRSSTNDNFCHSERSEGPATRARSSGPQTVAIAFATLLLLGVTGYAQEAPRLEIPPQILPKAIFRSEYGASLTATGGMPPRTWVVESGNLPPGLNLDSTSGLISGVPRAFGTYRFTARVTDSGLPPATATATFVVSVVSAFALKWKSPPHATADGVYGSVSLENQTPDDVDLTFIVVAVNEIGKAFALGYQHSMVASGARQPEITFGSSLPSGIYAIHVDAIGEVAERYVIYRNHLQSDSPIRVQSQ
jgi:hypothetical protein